MDTNRSKRAAEWFYQNVFQDEAIQPRAPQPETRLPSLLRAARALENGTGSTWQSRESLFAKQAKLLSAYEDDFDFRGSVVRYFPTYQALTDEELRGYFSWRTQLRKGNVQKTSLTFAFLYIYELINQIGVRAPMEGYQKLKQFREDYRRLDESILPYLARWLTDYVIYYRLDPALLADTPQVLFDRSLTVLENAGCQSTEKVIFALKQLSPKWLARSKFYAEFQPDCDEVICRVIRRVSDHYAKCKRGLVEQFFGPVREYQVRLFDSAVFCDPMKRRSGEFALDERCVYRCRNGLWSVEKHTAPPRPNEKLNDLLKTVDAVMREEFDYGHPIRQETTMKWLVKLIREETQGYLAEKKAAEARKITIDRSQLDRIRRDAAITRDKLMVDGEDFLPEEPEAPVLPPEPAPAVPEVPELPVDGPLSGPEYRLLQCLLYERPLDWVPAEGFLLSVLADSINEALYDTFLDSVLLLEDPPELVEDYIDDLKEMIHP